MDDSFHRLYQRAREHGVKDLADLAAHAGITVSEAEEVLSRLEEMGLLVPDTAAGFRVTDPAAALTRLFTAEAERVDRFRREVSRTRAAVLDLAENFQALQAAHQDTVQARTLHGAAEVNHFLDDAVSRIRLHECVMHPGSAPPVEVIDEMMLRDSEVVSRGVRIRVLYTQHMAEVDYVRDYLLDAAQAGIDIRLAPSLPLRLLILDDDVAVVPLSPEDSSLGAVALFGRTLVRSYQAVFDHIWAVALPLQSLTAREGRHRAMLLGPQQRAVARMLAVGMKDEVIARQLGMSARSLSRVMATLFEELQVSTRFQAGMKAAQLNLLEGVTPEEARATPSSL